MVHIYGKNVINAAIDKQRKIYKIIFTPKTIESFHEIARHCKAHHIRIEILDSKDLTTRFGPNHQGIVAEVEPYQYTSIEAVFDKVKIRNELPFFLMLDSLEDPHNLGAILRTADAIGIDAIFIPKHRSVKLNSTVAKVSTGAIEYVDVVEISNLNNTIKNLKKQGIWVVGTDANAKISCFEQDFQMPLCLVIGSEGEGISRLVKENCDFLVKIPMFGQLNSLNASVSAGILMYEVVRSRNKSKHV